MAWEPPELPDRDEPRTRDQQARDEPGDEPRGQEAGVLGELPRRERASLRGDDPRPTPREPARVPTPEQQAAARRAFADELNAFSLGTAGALDTADGTAPEE